MLFFGTALLIIRSHCLLIGIGTKICVGIYDTYLLYRSVDVSIIQEQVIELNINIITTM